MTIKNRTFGFYGVFAVVTVLAYSLLSVNFASSARQEDQERQENVVRAKKPVFKKRDWETAFFEDLFKEGLVGDRPSNFGQKQPAIAQSEQNDPSTGGSDTDFVWSRHISSDVLEDEVKRIQLNLNTQITSAAKFNSDYRDAKQSFSMLSMIFAVINEYDKDVRWKEHSLNAQAGFARAASFPSNKMKEAFEFSRVRRDSLTDLVRGSGFPDEESAGDKVDWSSVVDRSPLMQHLDDALYDKLRGWAANESEFKNNREDFIHHAQLISMMGNILANENMDDADDDDYLAYAKAMIEAADQASSAATNDSFDLASQAVNAIDQSCSNCHEEWR